MLTDLVRPSSSVRDRVSREEWAVRVDLAACYRLAAHDGWTDLVFTHNSTAWITRFAIELAVMLALTAAVVVALFTTAGEIDVRVNAVHAPKTAANFLRYVRRGAFSDGTFFRTVLTHPDNQPYNKAKIDVIQATNVAGAKLDPPLVFEPTSATGLRHRNGTVSMGRDTALNTAEADFFICIGDQPALDDGGKRSKDHRGFAAFGEVVRGMDVVRAIHDGPHQNQQLKPVIRIRRAVIRP